MLSVSSVPFSPPPPVCHTLKFRFTFVVRYHLGAVCWIYLAATVQLAKSSSLSRPMLRLRFTTGSSNTRASPPPSQHSLTFRGSPVFLATWLSISAGFLCRAQMQTTS